MAMLLPFTAHWRSHPKHLILAGKTLNILHITRPKIRNKNITRKIEHKVRFKLQTVSNMVIIKHIVSIKNRCTAFFCGGGG